MPGENIWSWSTTAANNATADTSINWAEGMQRATVNDSARSMMAAKAKERDLQSGSITTGGSANAQTFSSGMSFTSVPTGMRVTLKNGFTNTASMTLNMDGIGAVTVKSIYGANLVSGEVGPSSGYATYLYDGTNWIVISPPPGSMVLLDRQTASASTSLDFITGLDSRFDEYLFTGTNILPATNATALFLRVSEDSGGTFKSGASDYKYASGTATDAAAVGVGGGASADTKILLVNSQVNTASRPCSFDVRLYSPSGTAACKNVSFQATTHHSSGSLVAYHGGGAYIGTTNAINGVRFIPSSGSLTSGTIALYGIRK